MNKQYPTLEEALFPNEKKRGGFRPGSGRKKKYHNERVLIRCDINYVDIVKEFLTYSHG